MTLTQAAEWAGVGRSTIHKALTGKLKGRELSGRRDPVSQQWYIDPAELVRVFKPAVSERQAGNVSQVAVAIAAETAGNEREIALLREMLVEARREREDIRQDRDKWREQAETQTRLLTHERQPSPETGAAVPMPSPVSSQPAARPGLFASLREAVRSS